LNILVGEISSYKAIVIASFIREHYSNIEIYAYDYRNFTKLIKTKNAKRCFLLPPPEKDLFNHLNALSSIIIQNNIDIFIPVNSSLYGTYIKEKDYLGKTFNYVSKFEIYEQLHNKVSLALLATSLNIRIPLHFSSISEAICPFVIKPVNSSSARGIKYILTEERKAKLLFEKQDYLFQEFIKGVGCGYSVFAKEGKILEEAGHLRLGEYPVQGGSSVYRQTFFLEQMKVIATKIVQHLSYSGFAMFEFKLTENKELILIEVNPRIWGSINQGLANGVNYFNPILGSPSKPVNSSNKNTYLAPLIYLSFFKYMIKGNFKPIVTFLKNIHNNLPDISFLKDPKGYLSLIFRKIL